MFPHEKKVQDYTVRILEVLEGLMNNEDFLDELSEGDNATHYAYALSCVVPSIIINKIGGSKRSMLENNHLANKLIMQYKELHYEEKEKAQKSQDTEAGSESQDDT